MKAFDSGYADESVYIYKNVGFGWASRYEYEGRQSGLQILVFRLQ